MTTTEITRRDLVAQIDFFLTEAEVPETPERDRLALEAVPLARNLIERGFDADHAARDAAIAIIRALEAPTPITRRNAVRSDVSRSRRAS